MNAEKNINLCQKGKDKSNIILVYIKESSIEAMFDSGADCSLVRETTALTLPGLQTTKTTYLKGIGPVLIMSFNQVTTICTINNLHIELNLHVVLDHQLPCDIIIGRDILSTPGLEISLTKEGVIISRTEVEQKELSTYLILSTDIKTASPIRKRFNGFCICYINLKALFQKVFHGQGLQQEN